MIEKGHPGSGTQLGSYGEWSMCRRTRTPRGTQTMGRQMSRCASLRLSQKHITGGGTTSHNFANPQAHQVNPPPRTTPLGPIRPLGPSTRLLLKWSCAALGTLENLFGHLSSQFLPQELLKIQAILITCRTWGGRYK